MLTESQDYNNWTTPAELVSFLSVIISASLWDPLTSRLLWGVNPKYTNFVFTLIASHPLAMTDRDCYKASHS